MKVSRLIGLVMVCLSAWVHAGVMLYPPRLVIHADQPRGVVVTAINTDNKVYLAQSYVSDDTQSMNLPSSQPLFQVVPPLTRIEANSKSLMRVVPLPSLMQLPQDRESLFLFNMKFIPSLNPLAREPDDRNTGGSVRMLLTMQLKLFYRPAHLAMPQSDAFAHLVFTRQPGMIVVKNPSPYYITLGQLHFANKAVPLDWKKNKVIAPFGEQRYPSNASANTVSWSVLTDDGGVSKSFSSVLN